MPVFRPEALRSQDRLHGDVQLVPPVSWQIVGYFLLASVAAAAFFLSLASYGRVTIVTGRITGDKGILRAVPSRNGTVDEIFVGEGQSVVAGTPLARIRIATPDGASTLEQRREAALASKSAILVGRGPDLAADADARISGLKAQIAADQMQAGETASQIAQERQLLVSAQTDLDKAIVELNRVSGGIFAQNGIDVDAVGSRTLDAAGSTSVLPPAPEATAPPVRGLPHQ